MKNLSFKKGDVLFGNKKKTTAEISKTKNRSTNVKHCYIFPQKPSIISAQLKKESKLVQEESMKVLAEFENL